MERRAGQDEGGVSKNSVKRSWILYSGSWILTLSSHLLSMVVIPAFAMEIVCCSMASWIATLSCSLILSNYKAAAVAVVVGG